MTAALIIGSTVCDVMIYLDRLPSREGDAHIDHQQWSVGGCAFNVVNILIFCRNPTSLSRQSVLGCMVILFRES